MTLQAHRHEEWLDARHGVRKIRLTGGEPLVRRDLHLLVGMLADIPDLDLTLTTNGALLAKQARALKDAGLKRVTVSLDSLDNEIFKAMNDVDFPVEKVLEGMDAAAAVGRRLGEGEAAVHLGDEVAAERDQEQDSENGAQKAGWASRAS